MKLNESMLSVEEKLAEFDQWLTPKLERIKESDKFNQEIEAISEVIKVLGHSLDGFTTDTKTIQRFVNAVIDSSCSGQLKLATVLEFSQYSRSDSLGVRPPLY
ncbi:MAG: hypothetical protein HRU48_20535 [Vibrio sp.]|uniref:hypothetical protein n=1 Tax=Vibrio sp. TaxID=678 RepID=UPI001EC9E51D|nr:hypothetical protein [Vibrio sp.]NRB69721.1 hypothetical protein [Vibrio sp.]